MARSAGNTAETPRPTTADAPEFAQPLRLICGACRCEAKYRVGSVCCNPRKWRRADKDGEGSLEDAVCFTGLFRCKSCQAPGPWEFPLATRTQLSLLLLAAAVDPEDAPIQFCALELFDGTRMQCGAQSEDHLKRKIEEDPENAFLWSRLGNLYDNVGEIDLARPAYERAVELDPGEIESNYTLGCYCAADGDTSQAVACFQRVAHHAKNAPRRDPALLKGIVRDSLERLFNLHCESEGEIPFPPEFAKSAIPPEPADPQQTDDDGTLVLSLVEMDLGTEEGWETLTALFLDGRVPERHRPQAARSGGRKRRPVSVNRLPDSRVPTASAEPPVETAVAANRRVGRNSACPCGSGKKFKRCCGRS